MDALFLHRLEFAFTITFHYLFPQLTMGLGLAIVILRYRAAFRADAIAGDCARFLTRIFGLNFVMGVVTGIPMEFQFGAGWSRFSEAAGHVIGQTLAMEGLFAFFLESSFLYLLLFGEKKLSPRAHFGAAVAVWLGSWASGYFIVVTNAFMQHPVGYELIAEGAQPTIRLASLSTYLTNPWALVEYAHTITGSCVTAAGVISALGAFYTLSPGADGRRAAHARKLLSLGVVMGAVASIAMAAPTGDWMAKLVVKHQPVAFAAMEGHFHTEDGAGVVLIGQPNMDTMTLDNPVVVPKALSFITYQRFDAKVVGLTAYDRDAWPDNVPLLYFAYHAMVGIGTLLIALFSLSALLVWRKRLERTRPILWALMLALPFPYIANTAGWMTAELGRQPWLIHGLMRTADGTSPLVSSGNALFTLLGFMGLYALLALLFFFLFTRLVRIGPAPLTPLPHRAGPAASGADEPARGDDGEVAT